MTDTKRRMAPPMSPQANRQPSAVLLSPRPQLSPLLGHLTSKVSLVTFDVWPPGLGGLEALGTGAHTRELALQKLQTLLEFRKLEPTFTKGDRVCVSPF